MMVSLPDSGKLLPVCYDLSADPRDRKPLVERLQQELQTDIWKPPRPLGYAEDTAEIRSCSFV